MRAQMMIIIMVLGMGLNVFSQEVNLEKDQNPRYKNSLNRYRNKLKVDNQIDSQERGQSLNQVDYVSMQGSTSQETYKAIDPIEAKWQRKEQKKDYKAQKALWRQERRMARIENSNYYYDNDWYSYPAYGSYYPCYPSNNYSLPEALIDLGFLTYLILR